MHTCIISLAVHRISVKMQLPAMRTLCLSISPGVLVGESEIQLAQAQ
jgi:hypothetical protein